MVLTLIIVLAFRTSERLSLAYGAPSARSLSRSGRQPRPLACTQIHTLSYHFGCVLGLFTLLLSTDGSSMFVALCWILLLMLSDAALMSSAENLIVWHQEKWTVSIHNAWLVIYDTIRAHIYCAVQESSCHCMTQWTGTMPVRFA